MKIKCKKCEKLLMIGEIVEIETVCPRCKLKQTFRDPLVKELAEILDELQVPVFLPEIPVFC